MKIHRVVVGYLEENCYILEKDGKVLVIDPGDEIDKIKEVINSNKVVGVLVTHSHFDHIGALSYFNKNIIHAFNNLEEKEYKIEIFTFEVIYNPGHSKDSVSYYFKEENTLFGGDFIFYRSIGRCDLEGGDYNKMMSSISKIKKYPKDMKIYPGHGRETTLGEEIKYNAYFDER